ncbi:GGDEF domain-containing protein [Actinoplanes auranticolor]|uniref:GGDEF domain-containing protein n=1 Tax=Actinoplanes auranticolor TaxID=47988 RepID=UPI001FEA8F48|nr:diguanylate cyclase [Actinoplanes auranticolor]
MSIEVAELELRPVTDFRATAAAAAPLEHDGDERTAMRARLIRADAALREGRTAEGGTLAQQVNAWALERGDAYVLACSHRTLTHFHYYIGDLAGALGHAVQAVAHLGPDDPAAVRVRHLMTLAVVLGEAGSPAEAASRYQEALALAATMGDHQQMLMILGNLANLATQEGDTGTAARTVERMAEVQAAAGIALDGPQLITVARVRLADGDHRAVEEILRPLTRDPEYRHSTSAALPEAMLTLSEAHRLAGEFSAAQADLDAARRLALERGLRATQAAMLEQQAALYAAMDLHREAYDAHVAYHRFFAELQSAQRDAQARTLQAVFEATEARRVGEHFRELAHRDALTGLHNRRYADERLPVLLGAAVAAHSPLAVAIVDLDHFKRINDTLSHDAGDLVLRRVGRLLTEAVAEPAFAARLGGEEFLLVLPGTGVTAATLVCERLAAALRGHDWTPITGRLPVTASIGVTATADPRVTPAMLLSRADRHLYAAKHAGRDRVVADAADRPGDRAPDRARD